MITCLFWSNLLFYKYLYIRILFPIFNNIAKKKNILFSESVHAISSCERNGKENGYLYRFFGFFPLKIEGILICDFFFRVFTLEVWVNAYVRLDRNFWNLALVIRRMCQTKVPARLHKSKFLEFLILNSENNLISNKVFEANVLPMWSCFLRFLIPHIKKKNHFQQDETEDFILNSEVASCKTCPLDMRYPFRVWFLFANLSMYRKYYEFVAYLAYNTLVYLLFLVNFHEQINFLVNLTHLINLKEH